MNQKAQKTMNFVVPNIKLPTTAFKPHETQKRYWSKAHND